EKLFYVEPFAAWSVLRQVTSAAAVHLSGAPDVAVAEMVQCDGRLNQPLIKQPQRAAVILPQIFPRFVGFKKLTRVEIRDALQIKRIVFIRGSIHRWHAHAWANRATFPTSLPPQN